ncbi:hypothetical protein PCASD_16734 [Puccinia coronata f. sp. avenae]|uniref:Uncharacterized protein n=1 Tax=Puccinia coronata f. sp. avenae TaxID=200324 RepID=A0A2N5TX83_9BASI|nr:hypothetical protein PCASD_16734 [Puccinia coronata f. sp. avenae]
MQPQGNSLFDSSELPPLPFPNAPGGSQESWLGPSQMLGSNNQSCQLFYKEPVSSNVNNGRGNFNTGHSNFNTGHGNLNTGHGNMNTGHGNTNMGHRKVNTGQSNVSQMGPRNSQTMGPDPRGFQLFCDDPSFQRAAHGHLNDWVARRHHNSTTAQHSVGHGPPAGHLNSPTARPPGGHGPPAAGSHANNRGLSAAQPQGGPPSAPPAATPPASTNIERRAIMPPPEPTSARVLHLDYVVYIQSVTNELTKAHSNQAPPASKDWVKSVLKGEIAWKTGMVGWNWRSFKDVLIRKLDESQPKEHFGKHLSALDKDNKLQWKSIVTHHWVFGVKSQAYVSDEAGFEDFVEAVASSPLSKCTIKIVMEDPGALAKKLQMEKSAAKKLALTYGPKEDRVALERQATQLAANPKANVNSAIRVETAKNITNRVLEKYDCTAECLRIRDPNDASRSMRLTPTCLWLWARGIMDGDPGIDLDNPPITDEFVLEPVVLGLNKGVVAATLDSRSPRGTSKATQRGDNPIGQEPKDPKEPKRCKHIFTPACRLPCGCVMAPRSIKAVEAEKSAAEAKKTPTAPRDSSLATKDSTRDSSPACNDSEEEDEDDFNLPPPINFDDLKEATTTSQKVPPKAGHFANPVELSDSKLSTTDSDSAPPPCQSVASRCRTVASTPHTSDVDFPGLAAPLAVHRLPVRKAARSPAGDGVHNEFSRLSVERKRQPSPSPTRKQPGSQVSLSRTLDPAKNNDLGHESRLASSLAPSLRVDSSLPSDALPKAPLTKEGRELTLEGFLTRCNFPLDDMNARGLLSLNCIGHWDFFRTTTIPELMKM